MIATNRQSVTVTGDDPNIEFWIGQLHASRDRSGAATTSVTPALDGYILRSAMCKSPLGGTYLTDQFGEIHCPFPSALLFDPSRPCNAGVHLRDIELEQPCHGEARRTTPLFADECGRPYRHGRMDDLLNAAMLHCFGQGVADTHSWHSLRSGLASAL